MAKGKPDWVMAKALFESGMSLRKIASVAFIDSSNIAKKAKVEGWKRTTEIPQLIADGVSVQERFTTLELPQQKVVLDAINKQLSGMAFYQSHARKAVKLGFESFKTDPTPIGMKTVLDGMKSGMQVEGLVPFYPSATINNVNAQQTVTEKPRTIEDFYGADT